MIKKSLCLILSFVFLLTLTSCGNKSNQPAFDEKAKNGIPGDPLISENEKYRLELNLENMGVVLVDKATGQRFGSTPESSGEEKLDELGMPIKRHPQTESVILVEYLNAATNTEETLLSYTGAVKNGRVRCGKMKNSLRVEFYFDDADIMIPVDYSLNENGATISIDPKAIQENENKVHTVSIAPFWCSAENDYENSYLFVPVGSGALVQPITRSQQGVTYSAQVYGSDPSIEKKAAISETKEIKLPVYGAKTGETAVCAIIDNGAESAWIDVSAGSSAYGYSTVYSTFQLRGYTDHTATLFSNTEVNNVVHSNLMISSKVSVSFYPLNSGNADYNGMAKVYKQYLEKTAQLPQDCNDTALSLDIIGGADITRSMLGVPYDTTLAATTVKKAQNIISGLYSKLGKGFAVNLKGFGSNGIDIGKLAGGFELNGELGDEDELKSLSSFCKKKGIDLYMNFDIIRFSEGSNGFSTNFDSVTNAGEQTATLYHYDTAVRSQLTSSIHYLLSPSMLKSAGEKLLEKTADFGVNGVSLDTLSYISYSDYSDKTSSEFYAKSGMPKVAEDVIKSVKKNNKFLATNANAYAAVLADILTSVPTASSGEYIFKYDVPFYQMVFKGHIPLTGESVNLADDKTKLILGAVEGGCGISYTVMSGWDNSLIDSPYTVFYGSVYSDIEQEIVDTLSHFSGYYESISGAHIASHEILSEKLRCTTFDNGVSVYVNYGDAEAVTPCGVVAPLNYLVSEGA